MRIGKRQYQTIWTEGTDNRKVYIIDQTRLPFEFRVVELKNFSAALNAIRDMHVRGAPLIGVTAAFGLALAFGESSFRSDWKNLLDVYCSQMKSVRPTAVNLAYAVDCARQAINNGVPGREGAEQAAWEYADRLRQSEIDACAAIGDKGLPLIEAIANEKRDGTVNILTHCNAGWLACVDWGTALAPVYKAHHKDIKIHVWVDETRPRLQGSRLTAYELGQEDVPHTIIADNTGGLLMRRGMVDMVLVGSDRTSPQGDVCNKIGTYLKALAAKDNNIPFYAALPLSSIDLFVRSASEIPIEERSETELLFAEGREGKTRIAPEQSRALNYGFDITPARLVSGLITERGICPADETSIRALFAK